MSERFQHKKIGHSSALLMYKQGYTEVQCNSSTGQTIIINITGDRWIEEQFDRIFGIGEFKKFNQHLTSHSKEKNTNNPHCIRHTLVGDYIPKQARKDIKWIQEQEKLPGLKKSDLIGKYFK